MLESQSFYIFNRDEWKNLIKTQYDIDLNQEDIEGLLSLNDNLTIKDVSEIYQPILHVLSIYIRHFEELQSEMMGKIFGERKNIPFIISVSGSVSVGKSTFARLLQELLSQLYKDKKVQMVTTDGFLYPNEVLKEKNLMDRKGFPESYDMKALTDFLQAVKNNESHVKAPVYSHHAYDILEDEFIDIDHPNILIVEGLNALLLPTVGRFFASEIFDYSFYIDADVKNIKKWYLERYELIRQLAIEDPEKYSQRFFESSRAESLAYATKVWEKTNLPNLYENILPTRSRSHMIVHKSFEHYIDMILIRKY